MYKGWCRYWFRYSNASVEAHLFAVGASRASNSYFNGSRTSAPSMCTCNSMVVWTELLTLNFNKLPEFFRCCEQVRNLSYSLKLLDNDGLQAAANLSEVNPRL